MPNLELDKASSIRWHMLGNSINYFNSLLSFVNTIGIVMALAGGFKLKYTILVLFIIVSIIVITISILTNKKHRLITNV